MSASVTDEYGNAVGGLRSPFVDTPLARYSAHSGPGPLCALAGNEELLPADLLKRRYGDPETYLDEFVAALDASIAAGHLLQFDRSQLLDDQKTKARLAFDPPPVEGPS